MLAGCVERGIDDESLRTEVDERLAAADEVGAGGRMERAATLANRS